MADSLARIRREIIACRACPRLVAWREEAAAHPPRRFSGQAYWAKPVPGFGDSAARLLVVGLAPAAHGGNRTGRIFTGDSSGDFLFAALHRAGYANQARSVTRDDGLVLTGAYVVAAARCAPPDNKPTPIELAHCAPFLDREIELLPGVGVVVALGKIAWDTVLRRAARVGEAVRPRPVFGHGALASVRLLQGGPEVALVGSYHPSRQNTNTGKLTRAMLDDVFERAVSLSRRAPSRSSPPRGR
jgi:uracil-DNA glycosylase family 4